MNYQTKSLLIAKVCKDATLDNQCVVRHKVITRLDASCKRYNISNKMKRHIEKSILNLNIDYLYDV